MTLSDALVELLVKECGRVIAEALSVRDQQIKTLTEQVALLEPRLKGLESRPLLKYRGVFTAGERYPEASLCTHQGSLWLAVTELATATPGDGNGSWRLIVKQGRA